MNKQIALKWVKALRSGKYKQGRHYLNRNNEYCCLGVLCDILKIPAIQKNDTFYYGPTKESKVLPKEVTTAAGLYSHEGIPREGFVNGYSSLARANDAGRTFTEIANYIEVNYEIL